MGHDTATTRPSMRHNTARSTRNTAGSARARPCWWSVSRYNCCIMTIGRPSQGCVMIQSLYHDRRETWPLGSVSRYNRLYRDRRRLGCWVVSRDSARPRHGPTHGVRSAWALCARSVRVARVCWVCTLCTQLSFDSVHCSESLFGTLFMNTVHEHCSRGFLKK